MRLKHVLLSGLFLSTVFVACTNDELAEDSAPVANEGGISLGEGFTVVGAKINMGAETRALFGEVGNKVLPFWENTDKIGAAFYNMVTATKEGDETVVEKCEKVSNTKNFLSNTWMKWDKQVGPDMSRAEFKSNANLLAGAYVLYFPYNDGVRSVFDEVPVTIDQKQIFDATPGNEFKAVNDNFFAFKAVKFVPGGAQTEEFDLEPVPVLYRLRFAVKAVLWNNLIGEGVSLDRIIVEAKNASGTVLTTKGSVKPKNATAEDYNKNTLKAEYAADATGAVDHLTIEIANAGDAYKLVAKDTYTEGTFTFSALPFSEEATSVTVKVVFSDGTILKKEYTSAADMEAWNAAAGPDVKNGYVWRNITLDVKDTDTTIYTNAQFLKQWENAKDGAVLTVGEDLDLSKEALSIARGDNKKVTIEGHDVAIGSLNVQDGTLVIKNDLTVAEDLTVGASAAGVYTEENGAVSVDGTLIVDGTATNAAQKLTVASVANLNIAKSGIISIAGAADAEIDAIKNEGQLTLASIKVANVDNVATGKITMKSGAVLAAGETFTSNGSVTLSSDFENNGHFIANGTLSGTGAFKNNAGATLDITRAGTIKLENASESSDPALAAGVVNVNVPANGKVQLTGSTNNGTINVNTGGLYLKDGLSQTSDNARINVAGNAKFDPNGQEGQAGYVTVADGAVIGNNGNSTAFKVAYAVSNETKSINENVNTLFIGDFDLNQSELNASDIQQKNLVLTGGTLNIGKNDVTMTGSVIVAGDTTLKGDSKKKLTLSGTNNKVLNGKTLTVDTATLAVAKSAKLYTVGTGKVTVVNDGVAPAVTPMAE